MRILTCHNRYLIRGGEDVSAATEVDMLRSAGHEVEFLLWDNREVEEIGRLRTAARTIWSMPAYRHCEALLAGGRFDVVHVQNFFPLISPAIVYAARRHGVPVVQALRNYRLFCSNSMLFRDGAECTRCVGLPMPLHGIRHRCYRDSMAGSLVLAAMSGIHRLAGTWTRHVQAFVAVSGYVRDRYVEAGFPAEKIHVKPNALAIEAVPPPAARQDRVVYFGRLSPEKGVHVLIDAWRKFEGATELHIIGEGPALASLRQQAAGDLRIIFRGRLDHGDVLAEVAAAKLTVQPALWGDPFPRTVIESFAVGTPVLASAVGGMTEAIADGIGGQLLPAGDADALAAALRAWLADEELWAEQSALAQEKYRNRYSARVNAALLTDIFERAIRKAHSVTPQTVAAADRGGLV